MNKRAFGDLEVQILKIVSDQPKTTVKYVLKTLNNNDKYTTVMTVMNRLVDKGHLLRARNGLSYEYWVNKEKFEPSSFLNKIKQKLLGLNKGELVCHLLSDPETLTLAELDEIEALIAKAKREKAK